MYFVTNYYPTKMIAPDLIPNLSGLNVIKIVKFRLETCISSEYILSVQNLNKYSISNN